MYGYLVKSLSVVVHTVSHSQVVVIFCEQQNNIAVYSKNKYYSFFFPFFFVFFFWPYTAIVFSLDFRHLVYASVKCSTAFT